MPIAGPATRAATRARRTGPVAFPGLDPAAPCAASASIGSPDSSRSQRPRLALGAGGRHIRRDVLNERRRRCPRRDLVGICSSSSPSSRRHPRAAPPSEPRVELADLAAATFDVDRQRHGLVAGQRAPMYRSRSPTRHALPLRSPLAPGLASALELLPRLRDAHSRPRSICQKTLFTWYLIGRDVSLRGKLT